MLDIPCIHRRYECDGGISSLILTYSTPDVEMHTQNFHDGVARGVLHSPQLLVTPVSTVCWIGRRLPGKTRLLFVEWDIELYSLFPPRSSNKLASQLLALYLCSRQLFPHAPTDNV